MKNILLFAVSSFLFAGCLKDDLKNDYESITPIIINPLANWPRTSAFSTSQINTYAKVGGNKELKLYARVSSDKSYNHDLKITFIKDQAAIDAYNFKFNKSFIMFPDNGYSLDKMQITIPANQKEAYILIVIKPEEVQAFSSYMLAFTITDAEGQNIAANFKTILIPIEVV